MKRRTFFGSWLALCVPDPAIAETTPDWQKEWTERCVDGAMRDIEKSLKTIVGERGPEIVNTFNVNVMLGVAHRTIKRQSALILPFHKP